MKYFYSIVIDGYSYHDVTEHRYKNEIDFYYHVLPENFEYIETLKEYSDPWDYLDSVDCYPSGDSYVAVDENNNELEDIESCQETFDKIRNEKLINVAESKSDPDYDLYLKLKNRYE